MITPRGYVFIGLNILRTLSIVALVLVFASSIYTMVHDVQAVNHFINEEPTASNSTEFDLLNHDYIEGSTVPHQPAGAFWAVLNRLLIIIQVFILILSEIGWPSKFFEAFFPVLGHSFGLGALGVIQCFLGATVLSHHVDTFALVSAFFLFAFGCINILLGLIFRQHAKDRRSIFAWRERARDVLPPVSVGGHKIDVVDVAERFGGFVKGYAEKRQMKRQDTGLSGTTVSPSEKGPSGASGLGFGRQAEKSAANKGYFLTRPLETVAKYAARQSADERGRHARFAV